MENFEKSPLKDQFRVADGQKGPSLRSPPSIADLMHISAAKEGVISLKGGPRGTKRTISGMKKSRKTRLNGKDADFLKSVST